MRLGKSGTNFTKKAGRRSIAITDEDSPLEKDTQGINYLTICRYMQQLRNIYVA